MRLFVYGTLLDPMVLATRGGDPLLTACRAPAVLPGWRRVALRGGRYPTLRRHRKGQVQGALVTVSARALARLAAYEGVAYQLVRVVVDTPNGKTAAHTWIAPGGTRLPLEGMSHVAVATRRAWHARGRSRYTSIADRPRCIRGES